MNIYSIKDHNRELILHISGDDSHPTAPTRVGHDHYTPMMPTAIRYWWRMTASIPSESSKATVIWRAYISMALRRESPSMRQRETVPNKIENTIIEQSRKLNIEKK